MDYTPTQSSRTRRTRPPHFCGNDSDGQPTVAYPGVALSIYGSSYIYSDLLHGTHVPTSTSPTSSGVHEPTSETVEPQCEEEDISQAKDLMGVGTHSTNVDQPISREDGDCLENLPNILRHGDRLSVTQREIVREIAVHCCWGYGDDGTKLDDADTYRSLERWLHEKMATTQQTPEEPPPRPGNRRQRNDRQPDSTERYSCFRCLGVKFNGRYQTQRHLIAKHTQHEYYVCPYDCGKLVYRRDKVNMHYETHYPGGELTKGQIDYLRRTKEPAPPICDWCEQNVDGWDGLLNCMIEHCRDPESDDSLGLQGNDRDGGNPGGASGSGNNGSPGPAGAGPGGVPQQGGFNDLLDTYISSQPDFLSYGNIHRSSFDTHSQDTAPVESDHEASEHDLSTAAERVTDGGKSHKKPQPVSKISNVLHPVAQSECREVEESHRDMPLKECKKCGNIPGNHLNCQEVVAVFGHHNYNHDKQVQLPLLRPVGEHGKGEEELYSASLQQVNKKPCIRLVTEITNPIVFCLEDFSIGKAPKCLHHFDKLSKLLSTAVSDMENFAPNRKEHLFLYRGHEENLKLQDVPTAMLITLSVVIIMLRDFATRLLSQEPRIVIKSVHGLNTTKITAFRERHCDNCLRFDVSALDRLSSIFQLSTERQRHTRKKLCLPSPSHKAGFAANGVGKERVLDLIEPMTSMNYL
ncbi:predicted protein [Paecilomyces variotii No. 5]|uniref:C2H2-type domain-containing protein n=1 Tax=Byssochlamys spectabilis (strain No. 5 / NBRC 109023) TaxID=1356009 RepID=V5FUL4_BYSSN|nr:predicted protein [Paecilomyces variotii No. 5]